jgi:tyrosyl-tRNA synthetase
METLKEDFLEGSLHPGDLKASLTKALNDILQPVRDHFKNDKHAADLLKRVKQYKVTR